MERKTAARTTAFFTVLGFAVLTGCSDQPIQPSVTAPEAAPRLAVSSDRAARVANLDPRLLSGGAYAYFYGHTLSSSTGSILPDLAAPQALKVFPNVMVNNPVGDPVANSGQSETAIAQNGLNVVAGWNDSKGFYIFAEGLSGWGLSIDGGRTWTDGGGLPPGPAAGFEHIGDPGLRVSSAGVFHYTDLCIDNVVSAVCLTKGSVAGGTVGWGTPVYAASTGPDFLDKNFAIVSSSGTDIYMSYTRFIGGGGNGQVEIVASHDGGATWGAPVVIAAAGGLVNQGSEPAIGPGGEVYVVWEQGWLNTLTPSIKLRKSVDGGATFGATINVATISSIAFSPPVGYNRSTINDFPRIAVAQAGTGAGNVYVAFHSGTASNCDAFIARSTDGGATFGAGVKLNDDATTSLQWWPTVQVDANGSIVSHWYDRRLNPGTALTDVFWTISTDGGLTYQTNQRVTGVSTNWSATGTDIVPNFGDYNSIAVSAAGTKSFSFTVWADGRNGNPDVFFSRVGQKP
jgi:hypothetical protein